MGEKFTEEDVDVCWPSYAKAYLVELLNGEWSVDEARSDLRSLIGSKYDPRAEQDRLKVINVTDVVV